MGPNVRRLTSSVLAAASVLLASLPAMAQMTRAIPDGAIKADMQPPANGFVRIGKYDFRLAAGAQIRTPDNRIALPIMVDQPVTVRYTLDANGDVWRVWMLTEEEAAFPAPKQ